MTAQQATGDDGVGLYYVLCIKLCLGQGTNCGASHV